MAARLPSALPGGAGTFQLEVVTSVPFQRRPEAVRTTKYQQQPQRQQRGLFKLLLAVIGLGVATTLIVAWYTQRELPVAQRRAKDSEALSAPPSRSFCQRTRPPMVCAHGGDTTHAPPNTVSAFRASLAAGADCVEVDAALSQDGVLIVMHVRELAQLLGRGGMQVGDLHSSELLALRWPSGEAVMAVEEAVRLAAPFVSCVTLDVKTYNDKSGQPLDELAISEALVRLVAFTACSNCLIWAKSDFVVRRVLQLSPGQRTGYILMNETAESRQLGMHQPLRFGAAARSGPAYAQASSLPPPVELPLTGLSDEVVDSRDDGDLDRRGAAGAQEGRGPQSHLQAVVQAGQGLQGGGAAAFRQPGPHEHLQPAVVGVHYAMVEPQLLQLLHGAGKQLFAWTINQADLLRAVLDVGVDAVVTNYPLTALAAIDARLVKCGALTPATDTRRSTTGSDDGNDAAVWVPERGGGAWSRERPRGKEPLGDYL